MKLRYLSPSRINKYNGCEYAYHLAYDLGLKGFQNLGAYKGEICHAVLETILEKVKDLGKSETFETIKNYESILMQQIEEIKSELTLSEEDIQDCRSMLELMLNDKNADYFNKKIIGIERKFDLVISKDGVLIDDRMEDRAKDLGLDEVLYFDSYYSELDAFRVYGIIDLVIERDSDTIEIIDWKTGKVKKKYDQLKKDPQLLTYNMAARYIFPQYKNIIITIYYARGKPLTFCFDENDFNITVSALYNKWTRIRNNRNPSRNVKDFNKWMCNFCAFKKDNDDKSACKKDCDIFYELEKQGMDLSECIEKIKNGKRLSKGI